MQALDDTRPEDVRWADSLALGIEGLEDGVPRAAKVWLDTLGFSGWRAFRNKRGCVFATRFLEEDHTHRACRVLASRLSARGMDPSTPQDLGLRETVTDGKAIGWQLGAEWPALQLRATSDARPSMY
jgi:hypothetical protein